MMMEFKTEMYISNSNVYGIWEFKKNLVTKYYHWHTGICKHPKAT